MALIIFDIDGTLTQSVQADEDCFVQALADLCGFHAVDTDWTRYRHVTDSGLFHELHETRTGRAPSVDEVVAVQSRFIILLGAVFARVPVPVVTGADRMLALLATSGQHRVSLATGAWRKSARLKMSSAGLDFDAHPSATADDAHERETIITLSRQRATDRFGHTGRVVYVGDGVWDARACRNLGIPFIGIAAGPRAIRLHEEGAVTVLPDFTAPKLFLRAVERTTRD